ncbi:MAG: hypothetical protein H0T73_19710 [Ardenticatenales bacterium]|nr:hypothetical protein [Ardenticatenales bacterium]
MSNPPPPWQSDIYGILLHPGEPRLLLLPGADGYALPHVHLNEGVWEAKVEPVAQAMQTHLGIPLVVLRYAFHQHDPQARLAEAIYVLDAREPLPHPLLNGQWTDRETLATLPLARPEQRALLVAVLAEVEEGKVPPLRAPWARRGWFEEAAAWIEAQVTERGGKLTGPI